MGDRPLDGVWVRWREAGPPYPEFFLDRLGNAYGAGRVTLSMVFDASPWRYVDRPATWRQLAEDAREDPLAWDCVQKILDILLDRESDEWEGAAELAVVAHERHRPHGNRVKKHESRDRKIVGMIALLRDVFDMKVTPNSRGDSVCHLVAERVFQRTPSGEYKPLTADTVFDIWKDHARHYPPGVTKLR